MAEQGNRERVLVLADRYRILGDAQAAPDGTLWDFKHREGERFMLIYDVQFFALDTGRRVYDAAQVELNKDCIVAVFREKDIAFMRKD